MALESRRIRANGIDMHYRTGGRGPVLMLVHGWPEFSAVWEPVAARLMDRFTIVAPDLRGFGETENPHPEPFDGLTPELLSDDIEAFADAVGLGDPFGLVSHDIGAYIGQTIGRRSPRRLAGLFFFNCPYYGIGSRWGDPLTIPEVWYHSFQSLDWAAAQVTSSREACRLYIGHFLRHWPANPDAFPEADIERWVDNFMRQGNMQGGFNWYRTMRKRRMAMMQGAPQPAPEPVAVPTRIFWGELDPVLPIAWMDRLPEYFSDLQADVAKGVGHFVHHEAPDSAAAEIASFFGPRFASGS